MFKKKDLSLNFILDLPINMSISYASLNYVFVLLSKEKDTKHNQILWLTVSSLILHMYFCCLISYIRSNVLVLSCLIFYSIFDSYVILSMFDLI